MKLEEEFIFPAIENLLKSGSCSQNLHFRSLKVAVSKLSKDYGVVHNELKILIEIRESFPLSGNSSSFFQKLHFMAVEFEKAIQFHLYLKRNILFPEAIFLEEEAEIWD